MASNGKKRTRAHRPRKDEHVRPLDGASSEEIRAAYFAKAQRLVGFVQITWEGMEHDGVDSETWREGASKLDALDEAALGRSPVRTARMLLLAAIDDAASHGDKARQAVQLIERAREAHRKGAWRAEEKALLIEAAQSVPTWIEADAFVADGGNGADVVAFASFLFRKRCPDYASGLAAAAATLTLAVESWARGPGAPRAGHRRGSKWEACDALMKAAGLPGTTLEALRADWREWQRRQSGTVRKGR